MKKDKNPLEPEVSLYDRLFGVKENMGYKKKSSKRPIDTYNESRNNVPDESSLDVPFSAIISFTTLITVLVIIFFGIFLFLGNLKNVEESIAAVIENKEQNVAYKISQEKISAGYVEDSLDLELIDKSMEYDNRSGWNQYFLSFLLPDGYTQKMIKILVTKDTYDMVELGDVASVALWVHPENKDVIARTDS